jgi:hypothetical protein
MYEGSADAVEAITFQTETQIKRGRTYEKKVAVALWPEGEHSTTAESSEGVRAADLVQTDDSVPMGDSVPMDDAVPMDDSVPAPAPKHHKVRIARNESQTISNDLHRHKMTTSQNSSDELTVCCRLY